MHDLLGSLSLSLSPSRWRKRVLISRGRSEARECTSYARINEREYYPRPRVEC